MAIDPGIGVYLLPLGYEEYPAFAEMQIRDYAALQVAAGIWTSGEALERSRAEHADLVAHRDREDGHRFFKSTAPNDEILVWIWEGPPPEAFSLKDTRWLYQITVRPDYRRRHIAANALGALEIMLADEGVGFLQLNVHKHNTAARALYASHHYEVVAEFEKELHMRRSLRELATQSL